MKNIAVAVNMALRITTDCVAPIKMPSYINAKKEIIGTAVTHQRKSIAAVSTSLLSVNSDSIGVRKNIYDIVNGIDM